MRRMSGIWPPSKPMRIELPERAVWPLPPRPLVFPWPLDSPCPNRLRRCLAPGRGLRSCKRISSGGYGSCLLSLLGLFRSLQRQAAATINFLPQTKLLQTGEGRLDDVGRIARTEGFAQDVLDTSRFQQGPDRLSGN